MSGYFEIGIFHTKKKENIGTLWRSAYQLGAYGVFTIGRRYDNQVSDTYNTPNNIPLRHYQTFDEFLANRPIGALIIGIEIGGEPISTFKHPHNAIYLLGAEDHGLPKEIVDKCNELVSIQAVRKESYNVAVTGSIVMYDRVFGVKHA